MSIKEVNMNPEQENIEAAGQNSRVENFADQLVKSLDLPASLSDRIDKEHKKAISDEPEETEEPTEEEEVEESSEKPDDSEETKEENSEESKDEEDEELIPKSKVQKRIDELVREKNKLEQRLNKIEAASNEKVKDDDEKQLDNMSESELQNLKKQVRIAQVKNASNDDNLTKLVDLEYKIDSAINSSPAKFQQKQVESFYDAVNNSASEIENFDKAKGEIFNYAKSIFDSSPELRVSITGQARAWELAKSHYLELNKVVAGKSTVNELERKVNTLKKKISVESSGQKGVPQSSDNKLFQKAKHGGTADKLNFIKKRMNTDNFIPEEFLR